MSAIELTLRALSARLDEIQAEEEHIRALIKLYQRKLALGRKQGSIIRPAPSRGVLRKWLPIARLIIDRGESGVELRRLVEFARAKRLDLDHLKIRQQLHNWRVRGWVASPRKGHYCVTALGLSEMVFEQKNGATVVAPFLEM